MPFIDAIIMPDVPVKITAKCWFVCAHCSFLGYCNIVCKVLQHVFVTFGTGTRTTFYCIFSSIFISLYILFSLIQFICILESQVAECSMGSFYPQRF